MIGKRGEEAEDLVDSSIHLLLFMLAVGVIMALYLFFIAYSTTQYVPEELSRLLHTERFLNSCFAYSDMETGRVYPSIIDTLTFTDEQFRSCFITTPNSKYNYALRVKSDSNSFDRQISTAHFAGGGEQFTRSVLVFHNGKVEPGKLFVLYQVKK